MRKAPGPTQTLNVQNIPTKLMKRLRVKAAELGVSVRDYVILLLEGIK
jgi:plasmid stability protein